MSRLSRYQFDMAHYLRDPHHRSCPEGLSKRGLQVYGELVFDNVCGFLDRCFPVCRQLLHASRWRRLCRTFYRDAVCTSPWFHDIPAQFVEHLANMQDAMALPAWFGDLARYEWAELAVDLMAVAVPAHDAGGDPMCQQAVLQPARIELVSEWPLHCIGPGFRAKPMPPTCLVVFRDRQQAVRFVVCNPMAARLLSELARGRTGAQAVRELAQAVDIADAAAWWEHAAALLTEWQTAGLVLGTRP